MRFLFAIAVLLLSCESEKGEGIIETQVEVIPEGEVEEALNEQEAPIDLTLDICMDSIWNSPKVQALNDEIAELSEGERQLTMIPIEEEDEITVKLAEDNGTNFVTLRTFRITPSNNWAIEYYDLLADEYIDFESWNNQED